MTRLKGTGAGSARRSSYGPRFGVHTFIWRSPFATAFRSGSGGHAASLGAEVFEIAVEESTGWTVWPLRAELDATL